ncbi:MAG: prepilin peptidase [Candidatus Marinimicrobia bacterium]|nr:prepilin peptidase [Candidatus Neomarinimicrobiota bacterium]
MTYALIFVFGTLIGSFLNVVILRCGTGQFFTKGSSKCFSCGKKLAWHELIPVFSFFVQKGRCKGCASRISLQYPLVEFFTGFLFLLIFNKFSIHLIPNTIYLWILVSLLVVIFVYDLKHMIIPNKVVWIFNFLSFLFILFRFFDLEFIWNLEFWIWNFGRYFLSGIAFFGVFAFLWLISKGRWMGFGDAKLALGLGWFLGPILTFSTFLISFWLGAVVGIGLLALSKAKGLKSEIPFAPFLIISALASFLFDINILELLY